MQLKWQWLFILFLFGNTSAIAQIISGRVLADSTDRPLTAAITTHSGHQTSANNNGEFSIPISGIGDTIIVSVIGYKTYLFPVKNPKQDHIIIRLKEASVMLRDVVIKANRDHKHDSIMLRKEYAKVFNYQSPKLTDAFISPPSNVPFAYVTVDLLSILKSVTRKSDPAYRLKQELLKDEQADYVATRFNKKLVTRITGLKNDSLNAFMDKYYPAADWVKKTSDYDMIQYVKAKYVEFKKIP